LNNLPSTGTANLSVEDIRQQLTLFTSDNGIAGLGLQIFNDVRFNGLRPLARKLFIQLQPVQLQVNECSVELDWLWGQPARDCPKAIWQN